MKRIISFLLLFAALKVAGQTTGYLRYDTVKIMKQNGTCELYIINKTKDSLGLLTNIGGGLTRFIKPRVLDDSTFVIGLDTLTIVGGGVAPVRWQNQLDAGADSSGLIDASPIIQAQLNAGNREIYVPRGTYLLSVPLQPRDSTTIRGDGPGSTVFRLASNITAFNLSNALGGWDVQLRDFSIEGNLGDSLQRGIVIDTAARILIYNVRGKSLGGHLVTILNNGINNSYVSNRLRGNIIENCYAEDCLGGVLFGALAEYNSVSGSTFFRNGYGVVITGGNNRANNNNISNNGVGIVVTGGSNNAHGVANDNTINHCTVGIQVDGASNGFLFSDNMIYSSAININNSTGVEFTGGTFGSTTLNIDSCLKCNFIGVKQLNGAPVWNITGGAGSSVSIVSVGDTLNSLSVQNQVSDTRLDIMNSGTTAAIASTGITQLNFGTGATYNFSTRSWSIGTTTVTSNRKFSITDSATTGATLLILAPTVGSSSSSRILLTNDLPASSQIFHGSSTNAFAPNGLFINNGGTGSTRFVNTGVDAAFTFEGNSTIDAAPLMKIFKSTGRVIIGNSFTDLGQKLQVKGSSYITDTLLLGNVPTGTATDSVLTILDNVVYKVPRSGFSSGGGGTGFGIDSTVIGGTPSAIPYIGTNSFLQESASVFAFDSTNIRVGIGTNAPARTLGVTLNDAVTNAVSFGNRITHTSSGTVATNFGIGTEYEMENASGTNRVAGTLDFFYSDATNATEDATARFQQIANGSLATTLTGTSTGVWTATTSFNVGASTYAASATLGGNLTVGAGNVINWSGRSIMTSTASGLLTVTSNTTGFTRFNFGGNTSSFVGLATTATDFAMTLADGTGNAGLTSGSHTINGILTVNGSAGNSLITGTGNTTVTQNNFILSRSSDNILYGFQAQAGGGQEMWFGYMSSAGAFGGGAPAYFIDKSNNTLIGGSTIGDHNLVVGTKLINHGSEFSKVRTVTTTGNVSVSGDYLLLIDATGGNVTLTLPAASTSFVGSVAGIQWRFKRMDNSGNTVTIQVNGTPGTDTIDGTSSFTLTTQYESRDVMAISTAAFVLL